MSAAQNATVPTGMRTPWPHDFPDVLIHCAWKAEGPCLRKHSKYLLAKSGGNAQAANEIVEYFLDEESVYSIGDHVQQSLINETYVVAPARTYDNPRNALPHSLAFIVASELGLKVCMSIYQYDGIRRTRSGFWPRLANPVTFSGNIFPGNYIIVDDVVTTGGTMAALKGFIERQGSRVLCMSGLAAAEGRDVKLALAPSTHQTLMSAHGGALAPLITLETGYAIEHLTDPEGKRIGLCSSPHVFRQEVLKARHK